MFFDWLWAAWIHTIINLCMTIKKFKGQNFDCERFHYRLENRNNSSKTNEPSSTWSIVQYRLYWSHLFYLICCSCFQVSIELTNGHAHIFLVCCIQNVLQSMRNRTKRLTDGQTRTCYKIHDFELPKTVAHCIVEVFCLQVTRERPCVTFGLSIEP